MGRIRTLQNDLAIERQQRGGLTYDRQTLLARIVRLETEIILLHAEDPAQNDDGRASLLQYVTDRRFLELLPIVASHTTDKHMFQYQGQAPVVAL